MYRIVIGAESFDAMKPYEEIKEAKELVKELNKNAVTDESKLRTRQIGKLLDNLKISIEEIEHSDLKNDYMENNQRLRLNVNVFTEIIKEYACKTGKRNHAYDHDHIDRCTVFVSDNMEIIEIDFAKH